MNSVGRYFFVVLSCVLFIYGGNSRVLAQETEALFEEASVDWFLSGDAQWKFASDVLVGTIQSGSGMVMTKRKYTDFVLNLEFKPDSTINSGIFIHCANKELSATDCYEINIWDLHPNQENRTGAIVGRLRPLAHVVTLNKWNSYEIKIQKDHIQVWINGVLTADLYDQNLKDGYIALQAAGSGEIRFRNVGIRNLE